MNYVSGNTVVVGTLISLWFRCCFPARTTIALSRARAYDRDVVAEVVRQLGRRQQSVVPVERYVGDGLERQLDRRRRGRPAPLHVRPARGSPQPHPSPTSRPPAQQPPPTRRSWVCTGPRGVCLRAVPLPGLSRFSKSRRGKGDRTAAREAAGATRPAGA